jgi:hypothetical protein
MIELYKNAFSEEDYDKITGIINKPSWQFGQTSAENSNEGYYFFKMNLNDDYFFSDYLFNKIKLVTGLNFKLLNVYANGNLFGIPGDPHIDSICDDDYTFLIYANKNWDITWGGKTVFFNGDDFFFLYPSKETSVLFKSNLNHFCEDVGRNFKGMRISIAYKLKML